MPSPVGLGLNYFSSDEELEPALKRTRRSQNESDDEEEEEENDQIHIQLEYGKEEQEDDTPPSNWEIFVDYCPELRPKLPAFFSQSTEETKNSDLHHADKGLWPTYIHLPVRLISNENKELHHLENLITKSENLHISVTPTNYFPYPTCLEIANILYKFSRSTQTSAKVSTKFEANSVGLMQNIQQDSNLLYLVHYIDTESYIAKLLSKLQHKLRIRNHKNKETDEQEKRGYFDLEDNWNIHVTVGKYDTMGNIKREIVDQWIREPPFAANTLVQYEWDGTIVMYCGNRKFLWNCIHKEQET
jgi:hypothetical protein